MTTFESVGKTKEIELSYGQFIEITRKRVVDKGTEFISISKGEYYLRKDSSTGKRYKKNFSFGVGVKEQIIEALKEV